MLMHGIDTDTLAQEIAAQLTYAEILDLVASICGELMDSGFDKQLLDLASDLVPETAPAAAQPEFSSFHHHWIQDLQGRIFRLEEQFYGPVPRLQDLEAVPAPYVKDREGDIWRLESDGRYRMRTWSTEGRCWSSTVHSPETLRVTWGPLTPCEAPE